MKRCPRCKETKPIDAFYTRGGGQTGAWCKPCARKYMREYGKQKYVKEARTKWAQGKGKESQLRYRNIPANQNKKRAQVQVMNALRRGDLARLEECEDCGSNKLIEAHHDDYAKPLDVRWLCRLCHRNWHRLNGPGINADHLPQYS